MVDLLAPAPRPRKICIDLLRNHRGSPWEPVDGDGGIWQTAEGLDSWSPDRQRLDVRCPFRTEPHGTASSSKWWISCPYYKNPLQGLYEGVSLVIGEEITNVNASDSGKWLPSGNNTQASHTSPLMQLPALLNQLVSLTWPKGESSSQLRSCPLLEGNRIKQLLFPYQHSLIAQVCNTSAFDHECTKMCEISCISMCMWINLCVFKCLFTHTRAVHVTVYIP